jgi:hypothetical protein
MGGCPARDARELLRALTADRYREHAVEEIEGQHVHWTKYGDRPRVYGNTQEEMVRKAFRLYKPAAAGGRPTRALGVAGAHQRAGAGLNSARNARSAAGW